MFPFMYNFLMFFLTWFLFSRFKQYFILFSPCSCQRAVIPCDTVWCLVMPCDALWCLVMPCDALWCLVIPCDTVWCLVMPCDAVWYRVIPCDTVWCRVIPCDTVWCRVMPCDAVWCLVIRGTQREYSSKPLKHSIVKRVLVFKRWMWAYFYPL